ncbi:tape measure protein [Virgibacillus chiguensis]|uniref:Tape measure domain-containing protein n=1 Tax=Virgibacillus chiguensis TaxID=411959 RepID=A0A1M5XPS7_9BACI|nr:tape measure protein [Virgibacillus chiguensis]SHI01759.1 tape measure domain-containing protein [Virgibacillus chiguensis]
MSDGSIKIQIEVDGKQVKLASRELDKLEEAGLDSGKGIKAAESSLDSLGASSSKAGSSVKGATDSLDDMSDGAKNAADGTDKASIGIKELATSLGLVAIGAAAFQTLSASMDDAISRFDTLNTFPKVLQALGVSAEDSEKAMNKLSDGIDGLPTKLDEISSTAQRMYTSFNDMDKATDTALALNNALLGSGSSAEEAKRGTDQYLKALQKGKFELDDWHTLSETMDVGLLKIAESFGYTGRSAKNDLYKALQDGTITMDQFNDKLIEVGTGTGVMAKLAKENSLGIATSLSNLRNAAAKGIADIISSFDKLSKEVTGKDIAQNIDSLKGIVNSSFRVIGAVIESTTPLFKVFGSAVGAIIPVVKALSPAIMGAVTAYAGLMVVTKVSAAIKASNAVLATAQSAQKALTLVTKAQMTAQVASTTAKKADIVATAAQTGAIKLSTLVIGVMTGKIKLATAATIALAAAKKILMGPIGWVTAGIGALVGAAVGIVKWFNKSSEEAKKLNGETEKLGESTSSLKDSLNSSSEAYQENQKDIKATAEANTELTDKIEKLAEKENKSATEKQMLAKYIEQLNGRVEGLNLAYNEEANALSMSSEQLKARVGLMKEQEAGIAAQERLLEISEEQNKVDQQLSEINELRAESKKLHDDEKISKEDHKEATAELGEQENSLRETKKQLAEQQKLTEKQLTTSMANITEATENGVYNQVLKFEELSESQQKTVESMQSTWETYKEQATNMFDTLSEKSELSVSEMTNNLEKNQEVISNWADNIATLAERGVDEGLLNTLREAGPESAGHVNALVNASDEELATLSEAFKKGGDTATDALSKSLGIEESGVMEAVGHLVTGAKQSLTEQIESANFKSVGNAIPNGMASGISNGSKNAKKASEKMANDTKNASEEALGINSPSRVFKEIGAGVTEGLTLGINQGTSKVIQAVKKMFQSVIKSSDSSFKVITKGYDNSIKRIDKSLNKLPKIAQKSMSNMLNRLKSGTPKQISTMKNLSKSLTNPFRNTMSQFNSIGRNAMAGLNQGLWSGRGRVMSTARSIANSVASTMKSALRIHSPSRVMKDDVGRWIPEGIALGIKDNAKSVYDEINKLSSAMVMTSTPEVALGTNRMAHAGHNYIAEVIKGFQIRSTDISKTLSRMNNNQKIIIEPSEVLIDSRYAGKVLWKPIKENIDRARGGINRFNEGRHHL